MSVHITCEKCGKWLGGIAPKTGVDWKPIVDSFFHQAASNLCEDFDNCKYNKGEDKH